VELFFSSLHVAQRRLARSSAERFTVGWLIKIQDSEGNVVCVKQPAAEQPE